MVYPCTCSVSFVMSYALTIKSVLQPLAVIRSIFIPWRQAESLKMLNWNLMRSLQSFQLEDGHPAFFYFCSKYTNHRYNKIMYNNWVFSLHETYLKYKLIILINVTYVFPDEVDDKILESAKKKKKKNPN